MKPKFRFVIVLRIAAAVAGAVLFLSASSARAQTSLLSGCTVNSSNVPSCTTPTGWSLVLAEGYDSGALGSSNEYQLVGSGGSGGLTTTRPHTGARSQACNINFDGEACALGIKSGTIGTSNHIYVSYWRYMDANACNSVEIYFWDVYGPTNGRVDFFDVMDTQGAPGSCTSSASTAMIGDGSYIFNDESNASSTWHLPLAVWQQVEGEFQGSTCTGSTSNNDGLYRLYINGALSVQHVNVNLNGCATGFSSTGMAIEAGGVYTFLNSSSGSIAPPNGAFNVYIDDVIVLKQASGGGGSVSLSPSGLPFGNVAQGTTSSGQSTTLSNTSGSTITISSYGFGGTNATDFHLSTTCGATVANNGSCTITVTFSPSAAPGTNETGTLNLNFTGASGSPATASLSGTSTGPPTISPTSLAFGTVTRGTTSSGLTTTITNNSASTITFSGYTFTGTNAGDFSQTHTCGATLTNGSTCTVTVKFSPTAPAGTNEAGALNVSYTGFSGSPVTAALTGTSGGIATISPASLSFGTVTQGTTSSGLTATLANNSGSTITFTSTTFSGANASDFTASSNTCTGSLATGNTCAITVVFTPTASIGTNETGTLNVGFTGASGSPLTTSLTGTSGGIATISPASLSFGTVTQGTTSSGLTATLANNSGSTITFTSTTFSGANASDFTASSNTCTGSLATGNTCAITVVFTPTASVGTNESGTLNVAYTGASGSPANASLVGTSGPPSPPAPATSLVVTSAQ